MNYKICFVLKISIVISLLGGCSTLGIANDSMSDQTQNHLQDQTQDQTQNQTEEVLGESGQLEIIEDDDVILTESGTEVIENHALYQSKYPYIELDDNQFELVSDHLKSILYSGGGGGGGIYGNYAICLHMYSMPVLFETENIESVSYTLYNCNGSFQGLKRIDNINFTKDLIIESTTVTYSSSQLQNVYFSVIATFYYEEPSRSLEESVFGDLLEHAVIQAEITYMDQTQAIIYYKMKMYTTSNTNNAYFYQLQQE